MSGFLKFKNSKICRNTVKRNHTSSWKDLMHLPTWNSSVSLTTTQQGALWTVWQVWSQVFLQNLQNLQWFNSALIFLQINTWTQLNVGFYEYSFEIVCKTKFHKKALLNNEFRPVALISTHLHNFTRVWVGAARNFIRFCSKLRTAFLSTLFFSRGTTLWKLAKNLNGFRMSFTCCVYLADWVDGFWGIFR